MKQRPILFSAPMVRALLDGTKTQTRRLVKGSALDWLSPEVGFDKEFVASPENNLSPYGYVGDRLWVREAWARTTVGLGTEMVVYREGDNRTDYGGPWKPGIHMFRHDSRITLEITGVRVERLQDISNDDAYSEGTGTWAAETAKDGNKWPSMPRAFRGLWESINGAESWATNPWVWVIQFKRLEQPA